MYKAIDLLNLLYNTNLQKLPLYTSNLDSNARLAGFSAKDGNFSISLEGYYALELTENKSQKRGWVKCVFSVKQRVIDKPTDDFFLPILTIFLNVKSILNQLMK